MTNSAEHLDVGNVEPLERSARESLLGQRGGVVWLYGLSGSGKSTLAVALEKRLHEEGKLTRLLDGDIVRRGLNAGLGFSDEDRQENIRRVAEVARLFADTGVLVLAAFISPMQALRDRVREIVGSEDLLDVYVHATYEECERRDVKGLYAKAAAGTVKTFTGKDSAFEEPTSPGLKLDTCAESEAESLERLYTEVKRRFMS